MSETLSQSEPLGRNFANIDLSITPIQFEGEELQRLRNQNLFCKEPQTVDYLIDNSGARHLNMNAGILHQHRIKTRKCDQENLAGYWTLEFIDDESSLDIPVEKIVYYGLYNPTTNTLFSNSSELLTDINRTLLNLLSPEYCERATTIISTLRFNVRAMKRRAGWITTFHVIELRNLELAGVSFGEESEKYANVVAKISQIDKLIQNLNQIIATKERIVAQLEVSS